MNLNAYGIGFQPERDFHRRTAFVVLEVELSAMIGQELHDVVGSLAGCRIVFQKRGNEVFEFFLEHAAAGFTHRFSDIARTLN